MDGVLVWLDLEMTGLDPSRDLILEIATLVTDDELAMMVDRGMSFSVTPEGEMAQGHGFAITGRLRVLGSGPSLGVDL